jgi:hypothetical protein
MAKSWMEYGSFCAAIAPWKDKNNKKTAQIIEIPRVKCLKGNRTTNNT